MYVDDILVASTDTDEHERHLRQLFRRLQDHGLVINVAKCQFGHTSLDFLGHHITVKGVSPVPDKVEATASSGSLSQSKAFRSLLA